MKNILIYGVGSFKNKGCEALVKSTLDQLPKYCNITVATYDFDFNSKKYNDRVNKYVLHYNNDVDNFDEEKKNKLQELNNEPFDALKYELLYQDDVAKEISKNDICIHVGGDNYCYGASEWLYAIHNEAVRLGKKTVLWGASLYDEISDNDLLSDLNNYDALILRESLSVNAIKKYIPNNKICLLPDPAFSLKPKKVELNKWYKNRKVLGLNVSPLVVKDDAKYNSIIDFINYILNNTDYSISLIPHVTVEEVSDMLIFNRIKDEFVNEDRIFMEDEQWDCSEIKYIISKCDFIVAARTHASIAAYSSCVPTLVLGYSVKSRGIAEDLFGNYKDYVLSLDDLNSENLINMFINLDEKKLDIKNILKSKIKNISNNAASIYDNMIKILNEQDKNEICKHNLCSGCGACSKACPVNAITMERNNEGFLYPVIDQNKCIHCNKCKKVCPVLNKKATEGCVISYAAKSKNDDVRKVSSSGGIFTHLAEYYLNNSGVVYGAALDKNLKVNHVRVDNLKDLDSLKGSKYVQSHLNDIYLNVKDDLSKNLKVLFVGTPCQISGLKNFLNKDYNNLLTISVICHGVISDKLLKKKTKEFETSFDSKIKNINFKTKKNGWSKSSICYEGDRINKVYSFNDDSMMYTFYNNYALRESCYNCSSNGKYNQSDIILGDYWGVFNVHENMFDDNGVSAVVCKTKKGKKVFETILEQLILEETDYDSIAKYNMCIDSSVKRPSFRTRFYIDIENNELNMIYNYLKSTKDSENCNNEKMLSQLNSVTDELNQVRAELERIHYSRSYKFYKKLKKIIKRK